MSSVLLRQVAVTLCDSRCSGFIEIIARQVILLGRVFDVFLAHRVIENHACDSKFLCGD